MKILHIASEIAPYSKTGGLGDVLGCLPRAQAWLGRSRGDEISVVAPAYLVDPDQFGLTRNRVRLIVPMTAAGGAAVEVEVLEGHLPGAGGAVRVFLIDHAVYRRHGLYGNEQGDFHDNDFRFALLCRAALAIAQRHGLAPQVLHAHDWQGSLALLYARDGAQATSARTVLTIHNLAFQGLFPPGALGVAGMGAHLFHPGGVEFYGDVSYLKAGIVFADRITTVSPRYAGEIQTPEFGFRLDGLLRSRADVLRGILNGVDYEAWNPAHDPAVAAPFDRSDATGKRRCKAALQEEAGLAVQPRTPLFAAVTRLSHQKGCDLIVQAVERLLHTEDFQFVLLGSGDHSLEKSLGELAARASGRVSVRFGYDERFAHRVYAGADFFLMPSRFEPCGLAQLYALRYGAVPIVRATGGLDDTVTDQAAHPHSGTGFKFESATTDALESVWRRCLAVWKSEEEFTGIMRRAMQQDFSWATAARSYEELYQTILPGG